MHAYGNDTFFETIHLLEHLVLNNGYRFSYQRKFGSFNGRTTGSFLSFFVEHHHHFAMRATHELLKLLQLPLSINQHDIDAELQLLEAEELNQNPRTKIIQGIEKYFHGVQASPDLNVKYMEELHSRVLNQNPSIVFLQGDMEKESIQQAIKSIELYLASKETVVPLEYDAISDYKPEREFFEGGKVKKIGLYLGFPIDKILDKPRLVVFNRFLMEFIYENLFEYVRFVEQVDYEPIWVHRLVPYAWQISWEFFSQIDSENLYYLIENMFFKTEEDFERMKEKIYYSILLWKDDMTLTGYFINQEYLISKEVKSIEQIAEEVRSITYDEFVGYYNNMLPSISMRKLS